MRSKTSKTADPPVPYATGHPDDLKWPEDDDIPFQLEALNRCRIVSGPRLMVKINGVVAENLRFPKAYEFHLHILNGEIAYGRRLLSQPRFVAPPHSKKRFIFAVRLREKFIEEVRAVQSETDITNWRSRALDPVIHRARYGMENTPHYRQEYAKYCIKPDVQIKAYHEEDILTHGECGSSTLHYDI